MSATLWTLRIKAIGTTFSANVKMSPNALGQEIFDLVASQASLAPNSFKLMCSGRYIKAGETLEANKLKDGASILVMKTSGASEASASSASQTTVADLLAAKKDEEERVERVLQAAEALAKRDDDGSGEKYYLELTDQNGNPFPIGGEDRHAILLGLALHEKGRKSLGKEDYGTALEYLLAADKAFNRVNPSILNAVDNPGFLSLDIAWCYFMQQKMDMLKDAAWRLSKASDFFDQSYGPMQERLITLKGGCCPEMVVYVRLYLLEAIVSYHSGNRERAAQFLIQCEQKLLEMGLEPKDVQSMEDLGFTAREARIALRAANKNLTNAVDYAMHAREAIKERQEAERLRRSERSTQRRYGRCADGSWVDTALLQSMTEMGFERGLVAEALKQSNNVQHVALGLLTDHSHLLRDVVSEQYKPSEALVQQVVSFGFTETDARKALRLMVGDTERAVNYLLFKSGVDIDGANEFAEIEAQIELQQDEAGGLSDDDSNSQDDEEGPEDDDSAMDAENQLEAELRKAEYDLVGDIPDDPDAHLDFTLEAEAKFLTQYKSYLA
jgi:hypothetical protein